MPRRGQVFHREYKLVECLECGELVECATHKQFCANCLATRWYRLTYNPGKWSEYYKNRPIGLLRKWVKDKVKPCKRCGRDFKYRAEGVEYCSHCRITLMAQAKRAKAAVVSNNLGGAFFDSSIKPRDTVRRRKRPGDKPM